MHLPPNTSLLRLLALASLASLTESLRGYLVQPIALDAQLAPARPEVPAVPQVHQKLLLGLGLGGASSRAARGSYEPVSRYREHRAVVYCAVPCLLRLCAYVFTGWPQDPAAYYCFCDLAEMMENTFLWQKMVS